MLEKTGKKSGEPIQLDPTGGNGTPGVEPSATIHDLHSDVDETRSHKEKGLGNEGKGLAPNGDGPRQHRIAELLLAEKHLDPTSKASLTGGARFSPMAAQAFKDVTGIGLTKAGLAALYASALPETQAIITDIKAGYKSVDYSVCFVDRSGDVVAKLGRRLAKDEDGSLELYSHGCWVNHDFRGRAVSPSVMEKESALLSSLSKHDNTRLTLWAGGMKDPANPDDFQPIGTYVWANMGYDFAQSHGPRSRLPVGGAYKARCKEDKDELIKWSDLRLMRMKLNQWLDAMMDGGQIPDDELLNDKLKDAVKAMESPWHVSTFAVDGLKLNVKMGGKEVACDLGKAFMLSGEAPRWEGAFFVNKKGNEPHAIATAHNQARIQSAEQARAHALASILKGLEADDPARREQAVSDFGRVAPAELLPELHAALAGHPELAERVAEAEALVQGKKKIDGLGLNAGNDELRLKSRLRALDMYVLLADDPRAVLEGLLDPAHAGNDYVVARHALDQLFHAEEDPARLLAACTKLYVAGRREGQGPDSDDRHSLFSERVRTRREVVDHLGRLATPGAVAELKKIAAEDLYWETAVAALAAYARIAARQDPIGVGQAIEAFFTRNLKRHAELKAENGKPEIIDRLSRTRSDAVALLSLLGDGQSKVRLLHTLHEDPFWEPRGSALHALADRPDVPAAEVLAEAQAMYKLAIQYQAPSTRLNAVRVAAHLPNGMAEAWLAEIARTEASSNVLHEISWVTAKAVTQAGVQAHASAKARLPAR